MPSETYLLAEPEPIKKPQEPSPAQRLLDWLQRWRKPTISSRQICQFGPRPKQNRDSVIKTAEILVKHGWLTPIKTHRPDMRHWQIVRRPIVHPSVDG